MILTKMWESYYLVSEKNCWAPILFFVGHLVSKVRSCLRQVVLINGLKIDSPPGCCFYESALVSLLNVLAPGNMEVRPFSGTKFSAFCGVASSFAIREVAHNHLTNKYLIHTQIRLPQGSEDFTFHVCSIGICQSKIY